MRICLLYSESAGDGESQGAKLRRAIEAAGHEVAHLVEKDTELARALEDTIDLVVAAGGDGTVARAATALAGQPVPLAVLPLGTANNIARSFGIEGSIDAIIKSWDTAEPAGLDLGVLRVAETACRFIEGVGAGLIPQGIMAVPPSAHHDDDSTDEKLQRAVRGYRQVLEQLQPRQWSVTLDGDQRDGAYLLLEVLNMPAIGPSLVMSQQADPHDGLLSVVIAEEHHRAELDAYLRHKAEGRETPLTLPTYHAREIALHGIDEAHVDDDVRCWSATEAVSIAVEAAAVRLLLPKDHKVHQTN
jgi:diacylglycerol kinase family enzyme